MCFKITYMIFNCRLAFRLSGGWWKNYGFIEIFQICKGRLQDKFILCVLGYSSPQVIGYKVFRNSTIKRNSMGTAFYKTWELFIRKSFCIDQAAYAKRGRKIWTFSSRLFQCLLKVPADRRPSRYTSSHQEFGLRPWIPSDHHSFLL